MLETEVLIIGSGAAGLSAALGIAGHKKVIVISKSNSTIGSTYFAQGGIAAVMDKKNDNFVSHIEDTLKVGAGLCKKEVVAKTVVQAPSIIKWLEEQGINFTKLNHSRELHLTREGGHTNRRIVHARDATGAEVQNNLLIKARNHPNITILPYHNVVDLIMLDGFDKKQCVGAYVLDIKTNHIRTIKSSFTIFATGGAGKVYLYTSNPDTSSGDGIAIGYRSGCRVANMEFIQFHPTCLYHPKAKSFLISEALRGEGAILKLTDGTRFMRKFHKMEELAPRDIVARAIDYEMKRTGGDHVLLDISHKTKAFIITHFPMIYRKCLNFGFDISKEPIPVVPAAHYTCGGLETNMHGQTSISNIYAVGECASTGMHGANRMASNSLLECFAFAKFAAKKIINTPHSPPSKKIDIPNWDESLVINSDEEVVVSHNWEELRRFMWNYVGIVRTDKRLERALRRINILQKEISEYYGNFKITHDLLELRNLALNAELIIKSALSRKESRGLHYNTDHETTKREIRDTILRKRSS
ncbi:MAG: L-aspartate oxidase [Gammaproteobacteria bacterium]|nr:MAG: L-aspartate oxidase [Gammaproteobacteria bacterium]